MENRLFISPSPHIKDSDSIQRIMFFVIISLIPAGLGAVYFFGSRVIAVIAVGVLVAVLTEWAGQRLLKRPNTITDGSAILTGLLLAYNLPAEVPLWIPALGAFFGIAVGKTVWGGLGYNPMNPALLGRAFLTASWPVQKCTSKQCRIHRVLLGRAFLTASWPVQMTVFQTVPRNGTLSGIDVITNATPLNVFKHAREILGSTADFTAEQVTEATQAITELYNSHGTLFLGRIGGCIGETSVLLLLIGAVFLMYKRIIGWKIPVSYIGTVALLSFTFGGTDGLFTGDAIFHILSGGLMLGAFYMATDMVTTPVTFRGRLIFGAGCGIITVVIRLWGGYPEGVSYSILLMNLTTPLLDRYTKPKVFGGN